MKIVHLLYSFGCGGAERFVADLANVQASNGHDVTICIIRCDTEENTFCCRYLNGNVNFRSIGVAPGFSLLKLLKVSSFLRGMQMDILHCHHNVLPFVLLTAITRKHVKLIHTVHSEAERATSGRMERTFCRILYKHGTVHPVVISKSCKESFRRVYGAESDVIINGRTVDGLSSDYEDVRTKIDALCGDGNTVRFIHVSRCHPVKNQRALFEAFRMLEKDGFNVLLFVLGTGYREVGLASDLPGNVRLLGQVENVQDYLACCDAFCLSSFSEGLSIALIEAVSFGLTPVCTPVGGNVDVVEDGVTGYLSSGVSAEAYCAALKRCIAGLIDKTALKEYFSKNYSMDVCYRKYMDVYFLLVAGK